MSNFGQDDEVTAPAAKPKAAFGAGDTRFGANDVAVEAAGPSMPDERNWIERAIGVPAPGTPEHASLLAQMKERDQLGAPPALDPTSQQFDWGKFKANAADYPSRLPGAARNIADAATLGGADRVIAGVRGTSLSEEQAKTQAWAKEHPGEAVGAQVLGAAAPGGLIGKAVGAGLKVARVTPRLIGRILLGGGGAATYSAANEAGHTDPAKGGSYSDAMVRGLTEGPEVLGVKIPNYVIGATLPIGAKAAGAVGQFFAPYRQTPAPGMNRGATAVLQGVARPDMPERLAALGPEASMADTGPGMLGVAQGVRKKVMATPAQEAIEQPLIDREAGTTGRLTSDLNRNFGPATHSDDAIAALAAKRAEIGKELPDLWANAPAALDTTDIRAGIGEALNKARGATKRVLEGAKKDLTEMAKGGAVVPTHDPETLHNVKEAIDERINWENFKNPGSISKSEGMAANLRNQVNQLLRENVPGYSSVMDRLSELHRGEEGVNFGRGLFKSGENPTWPHQLERQIAENEPKAPGYETAVRTGARGAYENAVGTNPNDTRALNRMLGGEGDFNRGNTTRVFGEEPTQNMLGATKREGTFANTKMKVSGNAETAAREGAGVNLDKAFLPAIPQISQSASLTGLALGIPQWMARKGYEALRGGYHGAGLEQMANVLTAPDSPYRQAVVEALMRGKEASQKAGQAVSSAVTNPALASALMSQTTGRQGGGPR